MANKTNNYKFPKPEADDFYDISEYNKAMDILDDSLTEMDQKKLDKNGDASEAVTEFEQEILRENIESGETLSSVFGKVKKWFAEMKDVAFSGHAKDITTDAAHRFVSDVEKSSWNGKVGATGGDISETVINNLEEIKEQYPVPAAGESTKLFMGKVKKYIENTKSLNADKMAYVATYGSDSTGDGTSSNPFKTIKHALNSIPKDLGGNVVTIVISNGVYAESLNINCFINGQLYIRSTSPGVISSVVTISGVTVLFCTAHIIIDGIKVVDNIREASVMLKDNMSVTLNSLAITTSAPTKYGVFCAETSLARIVNCDITGKAYATSFNNTIGYIQNCSGASNSYACESIGSTSVHLIGTYPGSINGLRQDSGGQIINQNGTQISNMIVSGLSCSWGTIGSGYYRHGNLTGKANVIIQLNIYVTVKLTANTAYLISGFPFRESLFDVALNSHIPNRTSLCYLRNTSNGYSEIYFMPSVDLPIGTYLLLSGSYITNS